MSEQNPNQLNFWWPTSETGGKVMGWALAVVAVGQFINGCNGERLMRQFKSDFGTPGESIVKIVLFYSLVGVVVWYFIFNIGRYVYSCINRTEAVQAMQETRREKTELETLRRRKELKELREEFGDEPVADSGVPDARNVSSEESGNDKG